MFLQSDLRTQISVKPFRASFSGEEGRLALLPTFKRSLQHREERARVKQSTCARSLLQLRDAKHEISNVIFATGELVIGL